jgi:hypothetical protein
MQGYVLSPRLRRAVGLCFASTFVVIAAYLVFFLFVVSGVIGGLLEQEDQLLESGAYVAGSLILVFGAAMAMYAIGYVVHLWNKGCRREALKGLVTLAFLNVLAGYIWFYMSEVKGQGIRLKLI